MRNHTCQFCGRVTTGNDFCSEQCYDGYCDGMAELEQACLEADELTAAECDWLDCEYAAYEADADEYPW